jgi:L-ascorbate metabolism protein UlaG (beta-lactamase superfamily)
VKALADCGAEQALAHHHGTFQLTDEAIDAPVTALHAALDEAKIPRERFVALKPGQVVELQPLPARGRGRSITAPPV